LQNILTEFCVSGEHSEFLHINKVCNVPPQILGILVKEEQDYPIPSIADRGMFRRSDKDHWTYKQLTGNDNVWLRVGLDGGYLPVPLSIHVLDRKLQFDSFEVVFYEQPNPKRLQFLALDPLELDISSTEMNITSKKPMVHDKRHVEELKNLKTIVEYSHRLNGEVNSVSDDLSIVLIQAGEHLWMHIYAKN
jgi:phosphatidylinositol glycan class Q protein